MKSSSLFAAPIILAALAIAGGALRAQTATPGTVSNPVIVRTVPGNGSNSSTTKKSNASGNWMKAQVIHADSVEMIVSETSDPRIIHSFTYSANVKDQMQKIVNAGGYRYGDQVKILYKQDTSVALKIHGKPSKPS